MSESESFGDDNEQLHQETDKLLLDVISISQNLTEGKTEQVTKFTQQSKIAYSLWMYPNTRDSYVALALKFYEIFFPDKIEGNSIPFESFFSIPKMYDIQRTSAHLQNDLNWCPPSEEGKARRGRRQEKKVEQYARVVQLAHDSEIFVYVDESGKTDEYFILGGIAFKTRLQAENLESKMQDAFGTSRQEFKYKNITPENIDEYKKLVSMVLKDFGYVRFFSVILQNKNLAKESKFNKTEKCSMALMRSISYSYIQNGNTLKMNFVFDTDGPGLDPLEQEKMETVFNQEITKLYGSLCQVSGIKWRDSKELYSLQIADLFAGSLNNFYSKDDPETPKAKAKREFANWFLAEIDFDFDHQVFDTPKVINRILKK